MNWKQTDKGDDMKTLRLFATALLTFAVFGLAHGSEGMQPVKGPFDQMWRDTAALGTTKVYVAELDLSGLEIEEPDAWRTARERNFELTSREHTGLQDMYNKAVRKALKALEGYEVVGTPTADAVEIRAELVEIDPIAPKDDLAHRSSRKYVSKGAGSMTIAFAVSVDGQVIMRAVDRRQVGHVWQKNDRFNNLKEVRRVMKSWAKTLARELPATSA
jgi:hypothetical protein